MSITLSWPSQAEQSLTAIEIYRGTTRFTEATAGQPLVVLSPEAVSYVDTDVVENTSYYYSVVAVKNDKRTFSTTRCIPFLSKWGPAELEGVPRGDMDAGYLGYILNGPLPDQAGLKALLPDAAAMMTGAFTSWMKLIWHGKVLFAPWGWSINASYTQLNNLGLLFGTDDPNELPSWAAAGVNHKRVITFGEHSYIVRMFRLSNKPFTEFVTTQADTVDSEFRDTAARCSRLSLTHANAVPTAKPRFYDWSYVLDLFGPHLAAADKVAAMSAAANSHELLTTTTALTTVTHSWLVLELIP